MRISLIVAGVLVGVVALGVYWLDQRLGPGAKQRVIALLEARFDADVELKALQVSLLPTASVTGEGLTIRRRGSPASAHPMFVIRKFTAATTIASLLGTVKSVSLVRLEGLEIHVSPQGRGALKRGLTGSGKPATAGSGNRFPFVIEKIIADGTLLEIEPKVEGREPLAFEISKLTLHSVGVAQPMAFKAELHNPKPPGFIESQGSFGPWDKESPRETPLSGKYTFQNADLGVFKGISGILSSTGSYQGVLERIEAQGDTDTPDFAVSTGGTPVDLKTHFSAVIDGTNGDTLLQPVEARFLNTVFECRGGVVGTTGIKGKAVSLDISTVRGRIDDLLRLTVKATKPLLVGPANFKTKFLLPPGPQDVMERLQLDGQFSLMAAKFTDRDVADKLNRMSLRAQGRPKDIGSAEEVDVASDFSGKFTLKNGRASFTRLTFAIPGALVNLQGSYGLKTTDIDFQGTLRMQAKISQTVTGVKSVFLKVADPFFAKDGAGAVLPIKIGGTKDQPSFGLAFGGKKK